MHLRYDAICIAIQWSGAKLDLGWKVSLSAERYPCTISLIVCLLFGMSQVALQPFW